MFNHEPQPEDILYAGRYQDSCNFNAYKIIDANSMISNDSLAFTNIINYFPNPTSHLLTIQFESYQKQIINISIIDILGDIVQHSTHEVGVGRSSVQIDVSRLRRGMYFVKTTESLSDGICKYLRIYKL